MSILVNQSRILLLGWFRLLFRFDSLRWISDFCSAQHIFHVLNALGGIFLGFLTSERPKNEFVIGINKLVPEFPILTFGNLNGASRGFLGFSFGR